MRTQAYVGTTTVKCEGCGKRILASQMWVGNPSYPKRMMGGEAFCFIVLDNTIHLLRTMNTVCSAACNVRAKTEKMPKVAEELAQRHGGYRVIMET